MKSSKKYYLTERVSSLTNTLTFYVNEIGANTQPKQSIEFKNALKWFIETEKDDKKSPAKIYFHKDGEYKGYLTYQKAKEILGKFDNWKIDGKTPIEYLVDNQLLTPFIKENQPSNSTMVMSIESLNAKIRNLEEGKTMNQPTNKENENSVSKKFQSKVWLLFTALTVVSLMSLVILIMILIKLYV